jgi:hypothetical protein
MVARHAVVVLGGVMPDRLGELRAAQERARAGDDMVPEHARTNLEALFLGDELDRATLHELRSIGRGMAAEDKAARKRADRKRRREQRARLGLAGADIRRPVRFPRGLPEADRVAYELAIAFRRASPSPARRR